MMLFNDAEFIANAKEDELFFVFNYVLQKIKDNRKLFDKVNIADREIMLAIKQIVKERCIKNE